MSNHESLCKKIYDWKIRKIEKFLSPLALLFARLVILKDFWYSATSKLPNGFLGIGKGDWQSTLFSFQYEYKVPYIPPNIAAYAGTATEVVGVIMILLGFGTRIASVALLCLVGVIEFTYQSSLQHIYWASLFLLLLSFGAGSLSLDFLIKRYFTKDSN